MRQQLLFIVCVSLLYPLLGTEDLAAQHINGITAVATPYAYPSDPYPRLLYTQANWIGLVPYGFSRSGQTDLWFEIDGQWWGETKVGIEENIRLAKKNGLKIFLKPQVYITGSWPGDFDCSTSEDWTIWEANYRTFIMYYLDIAIAHDVEMFCVGTEFKKSTKQRPAFWEALIKDIRCLYAGQLTYSSNWDNFKEISFWDQLDYVGISAYFPLSDAQQPSLSVLKKKWRSHVKMLSKYSKKVRRPILFTEYGYLSVDGCAGKTWELEKKVKQLSINQEAQATAYDALYSELWLEDFWAGGFLWKWFPLNEGHEGYIERDYTPQDKEAEKVITRWFTKDNTDKDIAK